MTAKYRDDALDKVLNKAAGQRFHNHSPLTFERLKGDPDHIDLVSYIEGFSANVRRIFECFELGHFYKYAPPRPLEEIDPDLKRAEEEIMRLLREVTK